MKISPTMKKIKIQLQRIKIKTRENAVFGKKIFQ